MRHGYTGGYVTRDGHFLIENGLGGAAGPRTPWVIVARSAEASKWLSQAGLDGDFPTKRAAVDALRAGVYAPLSSGLSPGP